MKRHSLILALATAWIALTLPVQSGAQPVADPSAMDTASAVPLTDGEVKKVDTNTGKITIKHGDIKHLDMPGMTMVFTVKDKGILANVQPGDKVKFQVVTEGGKMVVTQLLPASPPR
ncbi:MAG TPA: copper-binding protein [Burkholderiaceae bacterium]|nr:copper-binding protein [Burkholderiaceae bacterium]